MCFYQENIINSTVVMQLYPTGNSAKGNCVPGAAGQFPTSLLSHHVDADEIMARLRRTITSATKFPVPEPPTSGGIVHTSSSTVVARGGCDRHRAPAKIISTAREHFKARNATYLQCDRRNRKLGPLLYCWWQHGWVYWNAVGSQCHLLGRDLIPNNPAVALAGCIG